MTDFFILLTIPNSGDYLQAIKKGILEITDLIVINKIDNIPENENTEREKIITIKLKKQKNIILKKFKHVLLN